MVRKPPSRLGDIAVAATDVFGRLGYRRTKMADVSATAGLSAGAIYTYVESKEALLHVVFAQFFRTYDEGGPALPVSAPPFQQTLDLLDRGLRTEAATPLLRAAAESDTPADVRGELRQILDEHYSLVERLWRILAVVEKCSIDLPELRQFYFGRRRRNQLGLLARYLDRRAGSGKLTVLGDCDLTAQLAIEAITWHAWHRLEGFDAPRFGAAGSRETVIEFICNALRP
jgi:AcrR family transcriptional regulator